MTSDNASAQNLLVLIDQFTKETVSSITYDVLSKHAGVITDIREISDDQFRSDVVIFEPAVSTIVTKEILEEIVPRLSLRIFVVYQNRDAVKALSGLATLVQADYSDINWNFVYAIVNRDLAILEPYQQSTKVLDGFGVFRQRVPADIVDYLDRFYGTYLTLVDKTMNIIEDNASLRETLDIQSRIGHQTVEGLIELKDLLDQSQDKVNSYEALLSESYDVTFGGFYPERPRVLYIKQVSHVAGIDTFLSVLFSVLTKHYKSSCKIIKLVDGTNALGMRYVPNMYTAITDQYNTAELLQNNFLMKLGAYNVMFDTLMLNRSGLDYLVVHDMRGTMHPALDSSLVDLRINELSADYALLGEYPNILSDLGKQVTFPWSFKECQKYTGSQVIKLVNHPTIDAVLSMLM